MGLSKYQALVEVLESAIATGRFRPGEKLPSVRELMGLHQLSLTTVTTALAILEEKDLVEPRARSGYFVKTDGGRGLRATSGRNDEPGHGFHWWPAAELFPRERLRKITATVVRRFPNLAIESPRNHNRRLQRQLAKRCAEIGCFVYPDDIMVTHGITEALSVSLRCTTKPGDSLVVQAPVAPLYRAIAESLSLRLVALDMRVPEQDWLDSLQGIVSDVDAPGVALLASNFHCPTGNSLSLTAKRTVAEMAGRRGFMVIEDDSSGDLQFAKNRPLPIKAYDRDGRVIYLASATKAFAPGLQVGWIVSSADWRTGIEEKKSISSSAVDYLPQLVLAEFLGKGAHLPHLRKLRTSLAERVRGLEKLLQEAKGKLRGLNGRDGGFNRFLWLPGGMPDAEKLKAECGDQWKELFQDDTPLIRFMAGGASVNLSFRPGEARAQQLVECVRWLSAQ